MDVVNNPGKTVDISTSVGPCVSPFYFHANGSTVWRVALVTHCISWYPILCLLIYGKNKRKRRELPGTRLEGRVLRC